MVRYALCPMPYALCPSGTSCYGERLYSGSHKSEVCPMPYTLCPMPVGYLMLRRKVISPLKSLLQTDIKLFAERACKICDGFPWWENAISNDRQFYHKLSTAPSLRFNWRFYCKAATVQFYNNFIANRQIQSGKIFK